ncbi:ADP-ribosylglycohydrolase family protein [Kordia zhangzhouensis]|uniref:ADP-ribosylglycohydrolase family protein n=1 Tax=Kordia zhangzhouensis TaxID=1620405 RepID=UPI000629C7A3|nr:ADP-ribosylglycohydrolase family protein [Kordia zhangzhouensis]
MDLLERLQGGIFGVATGDALGVPVEFASRTYLTQNPVKDMMGYMCWNQPPGTWSDDSSLTLCLTESLTNGYDIENIGKTFVKWYKEGYWGAHHKVFDVGGTTRHTLDRILKGESAYFSGNIFEEDNGNGSLMRTLPLIYFLKDIENIEDRYQIIKDVSAITHAHFRSVLACFIYVEFGLLLVKGTEKFQAYAQVKKLVNNFAKMREFNSEELNIFDRILQNDIFQYKNEEIRASGYVLHALEASLWCFLTTETYEECVLKAVNLGEDTDTTGAIAGGLAGLYYGFTAIPEIWKFQLARYEDIYNLIDRFHESLIT